ncbi:MAG: SH3-like domain-containing protein [Pseudomonadota bacterium]
MSLPAVTPPDFPPPYPQGKPNLSPGQVVRVRAGAAPGHIRTPWYLRGKTGVIERICGAFGNPEELAYNRIDGPEVPLYRVRFTMREVWGDTTERAQDTIDAEIFEHWLEAV